MTEGLSMHAHKRGSLVVFESSRKFPFLWPKELPCPYHPFPPPLIFVLPVGEMGLFKQGWDSQEGLREEHVYFNRLVSLYWGMSLSKSRSRASVPQVISFRRLYVLLWRLWDWLAQSKDDSPSACSWVISTLWGFVLFGDQQTSNLSPPWGRALEAHGPYFSTCCHCLSALMRAPSSSSRSAREGSDLGDDSLFWVFRGWFQLYKQRWKSLTPYWSIA